jgi:hypothetical protein
MKLQTKTPMISGENPRQALLTGGGEGGETFLLPDWRSA